MDEQRGSGLTNRAPAPAQRRATRAKIFQPGEMQSIKGVHRIHLLDLSGTGALVYGSVVPNVGDVIRLSTTTPLGVARVVWVVGRRFGVAFFTPLSAACLAEVVAQQTSLVQQMEAQPSIPARR